MTITTLRLGPRDIDAVVAATADAVAAGFFLPERGRAVAARLREGIRCGDYSARDTPQRLADQVTADMQAVQPDLHLRLVFHHDGVADHDDPAAQERAWRDHARRTAGGVRSVRRVEDGDGRDVAVLDLAPVLCHPAHTGDALAAAMTLVAHASTLVIDLRDCRGGAPEAVPLICGYLLGAEPVHLIDIESARGVQQFWSLPWVPGPRFGTDKPVAVLVSPRTFSGGEELAFDLQQLGRAVIVGQPTRGGAHPREGVRVHPQLEVTVPCARAVSPRTGTNWEGTGVTPDIASPEDRALETAITYLRSSRVEDRPADRAATP